MNRFFETSSEELVDDGNNLYLCGMKKLLCPQCKIAAMYVKNEQGERLLVYVLENCLLYTSVIVYANGKVVRTALKSFEVQRVEDK